MEQVRIMRNDLKWMRDDLRVIAQYFENDDSFIDSALWDAESDLKSTIRGLEEALNHD